MLPAWWTVFAASACLPVEIHWVMTAAWSYPDALRARLVTPVTRTLFRRLAQMYGFTSMPPMPPDPSEAEQRARAVRQVLHFARHDPSPVIGMAPEGRDAPPDRPGCLVAPPPGAGRFIEQLARCGLPVLPAAVWDPGLGLCIQFGPAYTLELPSGLQAAQRDRDASWQVMSRLAALLPTELRGPYAG